MTHELNLCITKEVLEESKPPKENVSSVKGNYPKYYKYVGHLEYIDVYQVLNLFSVNDHAKGHAIKKLLLSGNRTGKKTEEQDIQEAIELLINNDLHEVRSYNKGNESGLAVFKSVVFNKHEISSYIGAIVNDSKEIHYEKDMH